MKFGLLAVAMGLAQTVSWVPSVAGKQCKGKDIASKTKLVDVGLRDPADIIHQFDIDEDGFTWEFDFDSDCTDLSLAYLSLQDSGCRKLAQALTSEAASQVDVINLRYNDVGPDGIQYLLEAMASLQIKKLYMHGNALGDDGVKHLSEFLTADEHLELLDLNGNKIGDIGGSSLAEALTENAVLTDLNLEWNDLTDETAVAFGTTLGTNDSLKKLSFYRNIGMGIEGYKALAKGLSNNTALTKLELQWRYTELDGTRKEIKGDDVKEDLEKVLRANRGQPPLKKKPVVNDGSTSSDDVPLNEEDNNSKDAEKRTKKLAKEELSKTRQEEKEL